MNANELLTLLGLAWSRLILYPGGLAAFALIWLSARAKNRELRAGSQFLVLRSRFSIFSSIAAAWLGLALLPLPAAAPMSRTTDIVVVLALLEWPQFVAIARELHGADAHIQRAGARRLAAALNSYPTLLLATLALAQPAGSLEIAALARQPSETVESSLQALHWLGAATWTLALAPLSGAWALPSGHIYALSMAHADRPQATGAVDTRLRPGNDRDVAMARAVWRTIGARQLQPKHAPGDRAGANRAWRDAMAVPSLYRAPIRAPLGQGIPRT